MKKMQQAAPEFTTDADGQELTHVALANTDQRATLYAEDFRHLMDAGWSRHWALTNTGGRFEYVLAYARGPMNNPRTITLARLIAQAAKGQRVTYADGDRTNLRRDNLVIVKGGGLTKAHASALRPCKEAAPQRIPADPSGPMRSHATHTRPVRPTESTGNPSAPGKSAAAYTARVIDRAALSARVGERPATAAHNATAAARN
jgi:hypothetical protein